MDDVFDGREVCLLEHLSKLDDGICAVPEYIIYLVKKGVTTGDEEWA